MRIANLLIQTLKIHGVKYIFSLSGNQIMPIYDALIGSGIELIHVRHEGEAVHMADAWGRLTGTPGIALLPAGPGFANSLSATYVALMAESPVVILSGHAPLSTLGRGGFQEMAQTEMASAVSKAAWLVRDPHQIKVDIQRAFTIVSDGRSGPVHLALPSDLLVADEPDEERSLLTAASVQDPIRVDSAFVGADFIERVLQVAQIAQRPLVLAGPAVMRSDAFKRWATTFAEASLPLIGMDSPRGINDPALGKFPAVLPQADLLILLGKKLDFTLKMGQPPFVTDGTRIIQVDADKAVLELTQLNGDHLEIVELTQAEPTDVLVQLAQALDDCPLNLNKERWAADVLANVTCVPSEWSDWHSQPGEPLFSAEVGNAINRYLAGAENSILVSDGGEFGQWMQACVQTPYRVINGGSGSIGNAIPFALAARLAFPDARIVACTGDGAFGFHPFAFDTAIRHQLPFVTVVGNDARWNAEYQIQLRDYGADRVGNVDLLQTDYHDVVQALGGWGACVTDVDSLQNALITAGASGMPACINAMIRGEAAPTHS
ncbi:MAG: acetolactate synthase-1/2/3 large subunit [Cellvibrionaceae bacterium]|jgi:acetolactate synthase-1/2/3 large subunit